MNSISNEAGGSFVSSRSSPPLLDIGMEAGEAIYQMRSALDHLTWLLAASPTRNTQFPIQSHDDAAAFDRMTESIRDDAKATIRGFQPPFNRGEPRDDVLWAINELGNTDKHRTLIPVAGQITVGGAPKFRRTAEGIVNDGDIIAECAATDWDPTDGVPPLTVHLSLTADGNGTMPLYNVRNALNYIREKLVPAIEPHLAVPDAR